MKRLISISIVLLLMVMQCACGATKPKGDSAYLNNMKKGLEARWKISNSGETFETTSEYKDNLRKCVNAEINSIGSIEDYTFEDSELAQLANDYYLEFPYFPSQQKSP